MTSPFCHRQRCKTLVFGIRWVCIQQVCEEPHTKRGPGGQAHQSSPQHTQATRIYSSTLLPGPLDPDAKTHTHTKKNPICARFAEDEVNLWKRSRKWSAPFPEGQLSADLCIALTLTSCDLSEQILTGMKEKNEKVKQVENVKRMLWVSTWHRAASILWGRCGKNRLFIEAGKQDDKISSWQRR